MRNPYFIGDDPALTQTTGWVDAWTSTPSAYAVAATSTRDVAEAVDFARTHRLRLVVKGGGHSYQGTSCSADSLLVWTRRMNTIDTTDAFVPQGCAGQMAPQPAVTIGAGAIWMHVYEAVTTRGGRYVQGGGCGTVGVAGLLQGGGFGSFSKRYGTAAASLLEAHVVTADGIARVANACTNADLFWALKGGGGGTFGVVTSVTLKTHALPRYFGGVWADIKATTPEAFRRLIARFVAFSADSLVNEHWGETIALHPDNTMHVSMLFQGMDRQEAAAVWKPFLDWISAAGNDYAMEPPRIVAFPAAHMWDPAYVMKEAPGVMTADNRPGAPADNVFWTSNEMESGWYLYGYESTWLPDSLLDPTRQSRLVDALFDSTRHWALSLHFNKGLAGGSEQARRDVGDTSMNPAVLDAFALAIVGGEGPPAFAGIHGHEPDVERARRVATRIRAAADALRVVVPRAAAYVSESSFFQIDWKEAYWGIHYDRLAAIKRHYDPEGLFFVHQGIGSDAWSADGFTRVEV